MNIRKSTFNSVMKQHPSPEWPYGITSAIMQKIPLVFLCQILLTGSIFIMFSLPVQAQTTPSKIIGINHNTWFSYTATVPLNERWSLHLEPNIRRSDWLSRPLQILLRGGVNYHINKKISLSAGYAYIHTASYGVFPAPADFPENRIWEQIQVRSSYQRLEWVNRFRLEQRFTQVPVKQTDGSYQPGPAVYTNRFRLMQRFTVAMNKKTIENGTVYLSVFDEVMLNSGKQVALNVFDQNRLFAGAGYMIKGLGRLELGYMLQSIHKPDGIRIEKNNTILISLSNTLAGKHKS